MGRRLVCRVGVIEVSATSLGLLVVRVVAGVVFAGHGAQKAFGWWSGPGFAGWRGAMERMNMRPASFWAAVSTAAELGGGILLALGLLTPVATAALVGQTVVIVFLVHLPKGFWNAKGGIEYPLTLGAIALAVTATGPGSVSLDAALRLSYPPEVRPVVFVLGVIGGLVALAIPRMAPQQAAAPQPR